MQCGPSIAWPLHTAAGFLGHTVQDLVKFIIIHLNEPKTKNHCVFCSGSVLVTALAKHLFHQFIFIAM